jgi:hypothetical protein
MTSEKVAGPVHLGAASRQSGPAAQKENAARAALETQVGHTLSDLEWGRARARLVEFASLLRAWHLGAATPESKLWKAA